MSCVWGWGGGGIQALFTKFHPEVTFTLERVFSLRGVDSYQIKEKPGYLYTLNKLTGFFWSHFSS